MKKPELWEGVMRFTQGADSLDSNTDQWLEVKVEDAGSEKYLAIETKRWAFDSIDELVDTLKQVQGAFGITSKPTNKE